jgi:sugar (pentulose or hexulose) kinase
MRVLALDVGSSSVKAGYWDGRRFLARTRVPYPTHFDGPRAEVNAHDILHALVRAGAAAVDGRTLDAVAFCAFSSGLVVTDAAGNVRRPLITHQDRRSVREAADLVKRLGKRRSLTRTGNLPYPGGIAASSLAWLRRHEPQTLKGDIRVGQLSSLIGRFLTGQWTIDPSNAIFLGLASVKDFAWDPAACAAVGVNPDHLPQVRWADDFWGKITPEAARALCIPDGTPVAGGLIDTSAAVIQTPMHPGQLVHNAGSTDVLAMSVRNPASLEGILSRPVGVGRPGGKFAGRALWLAVRTMGAAGSAIAWARRELFPEISDRQWNHLVARACAAPADEAAATCIPTFAGERAALAGRTGAAFDHLTLATTRTDLLAALLWGLVHASAENFRLLSALHRPARTVYAMGAANSLADAMHRAWRTHKTSRPHTFARLTSESLRGLVTLATRL